MPDRLVELQQNPQTRRLLGILRKARVLPYVPSHGCSRVPGGPLEFSAASKSNKALLSRVPAPGKDALRFVFDPTQGIIAVDERGLDDRRQPWKPFFKGSHHQRMAQIIGAFLKLEEGGIDYTAAGGMIRWTQEKPGDPWVLETSEKSPHTGHAWNPAVRRQFEEFVRDQLGVEHRHIPGV